MDQQLERDLGRVEGKLEAQGEQLSDLNTKFDAYHKQNTDKMDTIIRYIERQKGASKVMMLVASSLATLTGAIAALCVDWFKH